MTNPIISDAGTQYWFRNDKLHRDDGPAVVHADGTQTWYRDGKLHRDDGPAIISADGSQSWYRDGKFYGSGRRQILRLWQETK